MSHLCHICQLSFTRGFNLRRHIERIHKQRHKDLQLGGGTSKKAMTKRSRHSSNKGSYDHKSQSDTNGCASDRLWEDLMTDNSETTNSDDNSDTEGADSIAKESGGDGTVIDYDGEDSNGRENVSCPTDMWEALVQMNKAMGVILQRGT